MKKVKIILPKAQMGRSTQALNPGQFNVRPLTKGAPALTPTKILKPVDRENANLEAEKGETVFGDINQDTMPEFYTVGGDRHYNGGTPLNLPDNTFIYSRDNKMKIKNPELLKEFGKSSKKGKGYTPADLSKTYDLTDFRKTLQNPDSDKLERETAERMIANYNMKLGKLALAQESLKGFPEGIPQVAIPYLTTHGINPANLVGDEQNPMMGQAQPSDDMQVTPQPQAKYGRELNKFLPKAQDGNYNYDAELAKIIELNKQSRAEKVKSKSKESLSDYYKLFVNSQNAERKLLAYDEQLLVDKQIKDRLKRITNIYTGKVPKGDFDRRANVHKLEDELLELKFKQEQLSKFLNPQTPYSNYPTSNVNKNSGYTDDADKPIWAPQVPSIPAVTPQQVAAPRKVKVVMPSTAQNPDTTIVAGANPYLKSGGSLHQYAPGGVTRYEDGSTATELQDGSVEVKDKTGKVLKVVPADKVVKGKGTVNPYGDAESEAVLKKFGVKPEDMNYTSIGAQKTNTLGAIDPTTEAKWREHNPKFIAEFEKDGRKFNPNSKEDMKKYEKFHRDYTYNGIYDQLLKANPNRNKTEAAAKAKSIADKLSFSGKEGDINFADQKWGNYHRTRQEINFDNPTPLADVVTTKKEDALAAIPGTIEDDIRKVPPSEWWLQDIIKTAGAVSDKARLQKYMPWAPTVQPYIEEPTFYDPTRELAANAGQIAIGTMGLTNFSDPQAYNARFSQIQGQGAENAANILGKYNNLNVTESNRANGRNAAELNKASLLNKGIAQDLYDKTIITNQQFDNSKAKAREVIRGSFIDAITNRAQTQALNSLYPQFNVSPITGGLTHFTKGKKIKPAIPQNNGPEATYNDLLTRMTEDRANKVFDAIYSGKKSNNSIPYQDPDMQDAETMMAMYERFYGTE